MAATNSLWELKVRRAEFCIDGFVIDRIVATELLVFGVWDCRWSTFQNIFLIVGEEDSRIDFFRVFVYSMG